MGQSPSQFYLVLVGVDKRPESSEGSLTDLVPEETHTAGGWHSWTSGCFSLTLSSFSM